MFGSTFAVENRSPKANANAPRAKAFAWPVSEKFVSDRLLAQVNGWATVVAIFTAALGCWGLIISSLTALYRLL
ncbi:MAG TPA: hypothetical protein VKQ29_15715 [Aliidongia sp.]|nr:hypothetical protein [Aliidongia sp.]